MRLEVAAGDRPTPGFVHHDARELADIEIVCDMWELLDHVTEGSCDELRATHILEHFSHLDTGRVLKLWWRLLKPDGRLYVEVPNGLWQVRAAAGALLGAPAIPWAEFVRLCFGDQDYPGNAHYTSFSPESLVGFAVAEHFKDVSIEDIGMVLILRARRSNDADYGEG